MTGPKYWKAGQRRPDQNREIERQQRWLDWDNLTGKNA